MNSLSKTLFIAGIVGYVVVEIGLFFGGKVITAARQQ